MADKPRFVITVEALPLEGTDGVNVPAEVRLRRLLKAMLRGYGLRCVRVSPDRGEGDESRETTAESEATT